MDINEIQIKFKTTDMGKNAYLGKVRIGSYFYSNLTSKDAKYKVHFLLNSPLTTLSENFETTE